MWRAYISEMRWTFSYKRNFKGKSKHFIYRIIVPTATPRPPTTKKKKKTESVLPKACKPQPQIVTWAQGITQPHSTHHKYQRENLKSAWGLGGATLFQRQLLFVARIFQEQELYLHILLMHTTIHVKTCYVCTVLSILSVFFKLFYFILM